jgi:hypothetical protein
MLLQQLCSNHWLRHFLLEG